MRVILLMQALGCDAPSQDPQVYLVLAGPAAMAAGLQLAERLRNEMSGLRVEVDLGGGSFKSQFKKADKSGAMLALVLGDDELAQQVISVKPLRSGLEQETVTFSNLTSVLKKHLVDMV